VLLHSIQSPSISALALPTYGKNATLNIDIYRDTNSLLTPNESWIMFAVNAWFSSPDLPVSGGDINSRKPLVIDLIFYHDCNSGGCTYRHFEDGDARRVHTAANSQHQPPRRFA
jgi:hypothetical protein